MSVEERLFALAQQCRQQGGDAFLASTSQLVPRLNSQAPDLHAEIRALGAALELNAAARIAAKPDQEAEASTVASEVAVRERLPMASVAPAIAVARRLGPLRANVAPSAPTPGGWAGDSLAVGAAPAPPQAPAAPYQPAPAYVPPPQSPPPTPPENSKAWTKNPLVLGAVAIVFGALVFKNFMSAPQQQQQPPIDGGQQGPTGGGGQQGPMGGGQQGPMDGGQQGPNGGGQQGPFNGQQPPPNGGGQTGQAEDMPMLQPAGSGGPMLQIQRHQSGTPMVGFTMQTPRGAARAVVALPAGGWQSGPVGFMIGMPGDPQNTGAAGQGQFQLVQSNGYPIRLAQIQMTQDNIGIGNVCVIFRGQASQPEVSLSGADFCVMDSPCSQPIGCGKLQ